MRVHKRKKATRYHGRKMGTCGKGSRTRARKSGSKGGTGMAGSGKRADHKKTLVTKLYGNAYFGKQGMTSKGTKRDNRKRINLIQIELNIDNYIKKGLAKISKEGFDVDLSDYKILREGEIKHKFFIKASEASQSAMKKVEKAGGKIEVKKMASEKSSKGEEEDEE